MVEQRGEEDMGSQEEGALHADEGNDGLRSTGQSDYQLAFPFSRVDVKADDAAPLVADLAALTARLARTMSVGLTDASKVELAAIADAADALASAAQGSRQER